MSGHSPGETIELDLTARTLSALAAADAGLIAIGTDTPHLPPGDAYHREIRLIADAGLTPTEIVQAATRNAAIHMGLGDDLGTLEVGKLADLIVVDGNPLEDLSALSNVQMVVQGGEMVVMGGAVVEYREEDR